MHMAIGDPVLPDILPLLPVGLAQREPLDPAAKAKILAEMPFVSDPVGQDLLDLSDATPNGQRARMVRIGLGAALGAVAGYLVCRVVTNARTSYKRHTSLYAARYAR